MKKLVLTIFVLGIMVSGCSSNHHSHGSSPVKILLAVSNAGTLPHMPSKLLITVTAPDIEAAEVKEFAISAATTLMEANFTASTGKARSFLVEVKDSAGTVLYTGSTKTPLDLVGNAVTLDIPLEAVIFAGTKQYGTPVKDEITSMATDTSGNVYMIGSVFAADMSSSQVVLMKQDKFGIRQWRIQFGDPATATNGFTGNNGYGVAVDPSGNVIITGVTGSAIGSDPKVNPSAKDADCFIAKYDSSGNEVWDHQFGSTGNDFCSGIAVDSVGNTYITGSTDGSIDGKTNNGNFDAFVVKYDASGNRVIAKTILIGTAQDDNGQGIAVDSSDNVVVVGSTFGSLSGSNPDSSGNTTDVFVVKYDSSLNQTWAQIQQRGSSDLDDAWGVAVDPTGNIYITGETYGSLDMPNQDVTGNTSDLFVMKYDPSGTWKWTQLLGTSGNDYANGIAADASGNVYVTGGTAGNLDGNTSSGSYDMFLVKYDTSGAKQWSTQRGTISDDEGTAVTTLSDGSVLVAGNTGGGLDGNANNDPTGQTDDVFLMKFDSSGQKQ